MSRTVKAEIEIKKNAVVTIRYRDHDDLPWDWFLDEDTSVESSGYYATIEAAVDNAERVLSV